MPQPEDEVKDSHVSDSPPKIATWWQRFHFSGRVIMCSVLFGLGLILIGGLIFAINVDDETKEDAKKEDAAGELPTKAPSNYVGPVVMGIGGFIVIVGVIMCLFETQVCRKKTGDSKPLISNKNEDIEVKISDATPVPSSSHCHKNHKHKSRKTSSSPRKTKNKHVKSHSHEQKVASPKSSPIYIDKSKNFMTSSEENFLTPPNTLNDHTTLGHRNSREAEIQTSSSLMKSFTSSGTWNQSSEFLTPTASYKEKSVSMDNSVELDEKQGQVNFKTNEASTKEAMRPEYLTPLSAEEERIQEMLAEMKNEEMKIDLKKTGETEKGKTLTLEYGNDANVINVESEVSKSIENIKNLVNDRPLDNNDDISAVKEAANKLAKVNVLENIKIINEENEFSDNFSSVNNVSREGFMINKKGEESESSDISESSHHAHEGDEENGSTKDVSTLHDSKNEKLDSFVSPDSSESNLNESENILKSTSEPSNENINGSLHIDLESSGSSEETLISHDNSIEKSKNNDSQIVLPEVEENSTGKSETFDTSESSKTDQFSAEHGNTDHQNSFTDTLKAEKVGASDLTDKKIDSTETGNVDEKLS